MMFFPYWQGRREGRIPKLSLRGRINADFLVVGGGIVGCNLFHRLSKLGKTVLVEKLYVGSGASGKACGLLSPLAVDIEIYQRLKKEHLYLELFERLEELKAEMRGKVKFRQDGETILAETKRDGEELKRRAEELSKKGIEIEERRENSFYGVKYANSILVNPYELTLFFCKNGEGEVYEGVEFLSWERVDKRVVAKTTAGEIVVRYLFLTTNYLPSSRITVVPITAFLTEAVGKEEIPIRGMVWTDSLFLSTFTPVEEGEEKRLLITSFQIPLLVDLENEEWKEEVVKTAEEIKVLASEYLGFKVPEIEYVWQGKEGFTYSGLPLIIEMDENVFFYGSAGGEGLLMAYVVAKAFEELLEKGRSEWVDFLQGNNGYAYIHLLAKPLIKPVARLYRAIRRYL